MTGLKTPTNDSTTTTIKHDANDYSRFDSIKEDIDGDDSDKTATSKASECRNCAKQGAVLKCSICKKANYCNRQCQTSDWAYHRRICKKPEVKAKKDDNSNTPSTSTSAAGSSSSSSNSNSSGTSAESSSKSPKKSNVSKPKRSEKVIENDESLQDVKGYKNGLPYFHRELNEEEINLIGDIAPKKINSTEPSTVNHDGSAWNHAGTFEERNYTKWAHDRVKEMLENMEFKNVKGSSLDNLSGDASICVVRGRKRFLFDLSFKIKCEIQHDSKPYSGTFNFADISSDGDYEIEFTWTKAPTAYSTQQQLKTLMTTEVKFEYVRRLNAFLKEFQAL